MSQVAAAIAEANKKLLETLPFDDTADFDAADRGFMGTIDPLIIRNDAGDVVWDGTYEFIGGDAPPSVNPSLWRQSTLVAKHGLHEVVEGIYQVRGFDLSNISFVETDNGVIVIDPLISTECAAAALALYRKHRGDREAVAVIHSHSHIDHFGGVMGVTSPQDVDAGKVQVLAPEGFVEHAVSENVYAGTAMGRRAGYMYGAALERGPFGQVGAGLGQTTSTGSVTLIVPTIDVKTTGETHTIDGLEIEFQMAPGTEAPSEMHFYFPKYLAVCMAENATHNLHNLLTLRGALVRDPHVWSKYLTEAIERYAGRSEVLFASHHWPTWGAEEIQTFLATQRDLYGYLHDQVLRLTNQGYTGTEIAEMFVLPPALEAAWNTHGYYGSVSHNVKAIYQRYMGWFDGNPATLWQHTPQEQAVRYVAAIGGTARVVELAQAAYDEGDFRWAATLLSHALFADPQDASVKDLYADTLAQLVYGSENGTWRNFYLSGAYELKNDNFGTPTKTSSPSVVAQLTPDQVFDMLAIQVDAPNAWDLDLAFDLTVTDKDKSYRVTLKNGVLVYVETEPSNDAPLQLSMKHLRFVQLAAGDADSAGIEFKGDKGVLKSLLSVLQPGDPSFEIVLP